MAKKREDQYPQPPTEHELAEMLGRVKANWDVLNKYLVETFEPVSSEWKSYSKKVPWTLQLKHKKRTIIYLTPEKRNFMAVLVYGDKAVKIASDSNLPPDIMTSINEARKYVEGRPIRIQVRTKKDIVLVKKLVAIKMSS